MNTYFLETEGLGTPREANDQLAYAIDHLKEIRGKGQGDHYGGLVKTFDAVLPVGLNIEVEANEPWQAMTLAAWATGFTNWRVRQVISPQQLLEITGAAARAIQTGPPATARL